MLSLALKVERYLEKRVGGLWEPGKVKKLILP